MEKAANAAKPAFAPGERWILAATILASSMAFIDGPALVGAGFFYMAFAGVTRGPSDCWSAFLPGISLTGFGMGITVAPLTASVMGSVASHYSGVASGVNNAVSRTAGVLAIAIVGALALITFATALQNRTAALDLPLDASQALIAQAGKLGAASVPAGIPAQRASAVDADIKQSFADTFRLVMFIAAALAWISAACAAVLVESRPPK